MRLYIYKKIWSYNVTGKILGVPWIATRDLLFREAHEVRSFVKF